MMIRDSGLLLIWATLYIFVGMRWVFFLPVNNDSNFVTSSFKCDFMAEVLTRAMWQPTALNGITRHFSV